MNAACPQIWLTFDGICQFKETQHVFLYVLCLINVLHLFYILVSPFVKICMGKITSARKELRWLVLTLTTIPLPVCFLGGLIHRLSSAWTQRDRFNLRVWLGTLSFGPAAPFGCVVVFLWARALAVSIGNRIWTTARASGPSRQREEQRSRSPWWEASFVLSWWYLCVFPPFTHFKKFASVVWADTHGVSLETVRREVLNYKNGSQVFGCREEQGLTENEWISTAPVSCFLS